MMLGTLLKDKVQSPKFKVQSPNFMHEARGTRDEALFIGRFQPFHLGHLFAIEYILRQNHDKIIIVIGSAQYSHTFENPFTAGERYEMIANTLFHSSAFQVTHSNIQTFQLSTFYIIPIEDVHRYNIWVSHVESLTPHFDVVYTNNRLTEQLFKEKGYNVQNIPLIKRKYYQGKYIRNLIRNGKNWEKYVPDPVAKYIKKINGVERLKTNNG